MPVKIYALLDPTSREIRYIGKTKHSLKPRLCAHIWDVKRGRVSIPRYRWIARLLARGVEPEIIELDSVAEAEWQDAERYWIASFRKCGARLSNATDGGDGIHGHRHSAETRAKQSAAALRRYLDPKEHEKTSAGVRASHSRPEYLAGARERAKHYSPARLAKWHEAAIAYRRSAEGRAACAANHRGKMVSEETRRKLSTSAKGRKRSPESIEASRRGNIGRKRSLKTRWLQSLVLTGLTASDAEVIRGLAKEGTSATVIARQFNIHRSTVRRIADRPLC